MNWFTVLKMPNPYGGRWNDLTGGEYYRMDDNDKRNYHSSMHQMYERQIKRAVEPRKAGQAPPATDEQIRGLRELTRFHSRQYQRMRHPSINKENYYSLEEEKNRQMSKPQYDAVERMPHTTKEMYDNYTRERKIQYWNRLAQKLKSEYGIGNTDVVRLAARMVKRMIDNPNYNPPFEGDDANMIEYRDKHKYKDISGYDDFTDEEKRNYHTRMKERALRVNKTDEMNYHSRMKHRITNNSSLPTYPTPEAEKEAEQ